LPGFRRHFTIRDLFVLTALVAISCALGKSLDWGWGYAFGLLALITWAIAEFESWPSITLGRFSSLVAAVFALIAIVCILVPFLDPFAPWKKPTGTLMTVLLMSAINALCWGTAAITIWSGGRPLAIIAISFGLAALLVAALA
jgi:hypothetical protein